MDIIAARLLWPRHADGRPKNMGEMTREEQRAQVVAIVGGRYPKTIAFGESCTFKIHEGTWVIESDKPAK